MLRFTAFLLAIVAAIQGFGSFEYSHANCSGAPGGFNVAQVAPFCTDDDEGGSSVFKCNGQMIEIDFYTDSTTCGGTSQRMTAASPVPCSDGIIVSCLPLPASLASATFDATMVLYSGDDCTGNVVAALSYKKDICIIDIDDSTIVSEKLVVSNGVYIINEYSSSDCTGSVSNITVLGSANNVTCQANPDANAGPGILGANSGMAVIHTTPIAAGELASQYGSGCLAHISMVNLMVVAILAFWMM
eukprot:TRINITY_DN8197_c0_g2_i1.p1 TRINITY_DN8197_c0_g2~~TRINITY_DN8197_c0_g2_i1.p1  ORF type:complete len:245 (+),score=52.87 TRINITY_DN8197_c0_g2_i1:778-1512(+)